MSSDFIAPEQPAILRRIAEVRKVEDRHRGTARRESFSRSEVERLGREMADALNRPYGPKFRILAEVALADHYEKVADQLKRYRHRVQQGQQPIPFGGTLD